MTAKSDASTEVWIDPDDAPELTEEDFAKAKRMIGGREVPEDVFREAVQAARSMRSKVPVTIHFSSEVVEYFKATGPGWQARMDEALKEWTESHR